MSSSFRKIILSLAVVAAVVPFAASAESPDAGKMAQLQALLAQIHTLQEQMKTLVGTSTPPMREEEHRNATSTAPQMMPPPGQAGKMLCVALSRNLGPGSQGDDVKSLQQMLASDSTSGFSGAPTGFFGPKTVEAMRRFQMMNGIASSTTGSVGPMTRGFFERRCGKGLGQGEGERGDSGRGPGMMGDGKKMRLPLLPRGEGYHAQESAGSDQ